jgi:hypothetical protein
MARENSKRAYSDALEYFMDNSSILTKLLELCLTLALSVSQSSLSDSYKGKEGKVSKENQERS